jgi:F-type H+-transporting ATPase subunit b
MKKLIVFLLTTSPAYAATGPFISLGNTDFVVLIAFLMFVGVLVYMKVPGKITGMLDARAAAIKADLEEAKALREEARALLSSYEKKQKEVQEQSERIVSQAKAEAEAVAVQAKEDLKESIARRLIAAQEQISSAEAQALRSVREQAVALAVAAAGDVLTKQMTKKRASASIDAAIAQVDAKFH